MRRVGGEKVGGQGWGKSLFPQHVCWYSSGVGTSAGVNDQLEGLKGPKTGVLLAYSSAYRPTSTKMGTIAWYMDPFFRGHISGLCPLKPPIAAAAFSHITGGPLVRSGA